MSPTTVFSSSTYTVPTLYFFVNNPVPTLELFVQVAALRNEIQILTQLHHENICEMEEFFVIGNKIYLILEYCSGGELFDRIVKNGVFDESTAVNYIRQILLGLEYMHERSCVHRDLKPENLLFKDTTSDRLLISDFGLSKLIPQGSLLATSCGSPIYTAPEAIDLKVNYGTKVDVWAVGVIAHILLVGYPPFFDENQSRLFDLIQEGILYFEEEGTASRPAQL
ncbi:MAG: hypothetical protein SGCHY_004098 [Lobulomycetales sp.]